MDGRTDRQTDVDSKTVRYKLLYIRSRTVVGLLTKTMTMTIITALHICRAVFPTAKVSVCPSVTRVNCDKTNESSAEILIPYMKGKFM